MPFFYTAKMGLLMSLHHLFFKRNNSLLGIKEIIMIISKKIDSSRVSMVRRRIR